MNTNDISLINQLSDQQLLAQVRLLAQREREATAALISHLAVLDERGLYRGEGCSSMFTYCVQVLHFSEPAAYKRIEVARAARKYPVILELLADGSVNLTTVLLLAPHLTLENHVDRSRPPSIRRSVKLRNSWRRYDLYPLSPQRSVGSQPRNAQHSWRPAIRRVLRPSLIR